MTKIDSYAPSVNQPCFVHEVIRYVPCVGVNHELFRSLT